MRFKSTAVLLLVFLVLGGYVYFGEYRGQEQRQKQEQEKKKVFTVDEKDITEISLTYPNRTITGVKKGEKQWEITSPAGVEADPDEWELLATDIPMIDRDDAVAQNVQDLSQFGLKDPAVKVSVRMKDGKTLEILFGAPNPKKTYNYAKLGSGSEVFLTGSTWATTFTKKLSDLRNKKLLQFDSADIDGIKIAEGATQLDIHKTGEDWTLNKPIQAQADAGEISSFTSAISFARAASFPDEPVDMKAAGLEPPAMTITLHDGKSKSDRTLLIGKTSGADRYYARDASRPAVFIIDKEIPEKARRPVFDWRDKTVVHVDREKLNRIEIVRGADTLAVVKSGEDWKLPDGKKAQMDKVSSMLNDLDFEKAKDIVDQPKTPAAYGLDKPRLVVVLRQGSTELARVAFGNNSQNPEGVYAQTSGRPAVEVLSKDIFDRFNVKPEDLAETEKPKS